MNPPKINRFFLSKTSSHRRNKQCTCFCNIVKVYETEPNNISLLIDYMQEIQDYGPPPSDIIQEMAPNIELDEHGIPKMDHTTNTKNLPSFLGGDTTKDECLIM